MDRKDTIVVGVDGSEIGRRALRWALGEAARTGYQVRAITAWSASMSTQPGLFDPKAAAERAEHLLAEEVRAVNADRPEPLPVEQQVVEGEPAKTLVAASTEAALLVLGSHGHSRLFQALVGSVTAECVRHAACPVVIIPPVSRGEPHQPATEAFSAPLF
jgi:nucleotide-binding universal stress UspA family protein